MRRRLLILLIQTAAVLGLAACTAPSTPAPQTGARRTADSSYVRSIYGPTWTLIALRGAPAAVGRGGRAATLIFYSGEGRQARGFAGCNQWSSTYTLPGRDSIRFAPPTSTRMACAEGGDLEARFLAFLEQTRRGRQQDSTLILYDQRGDSARFVARLD